MDQMGLAWIAHMTHSNNHLILPFHHLMQIQQYMASSEIGNFLCRSGLRLLYWLLYLHDACDNIRLFQQNNHAMFVFVELM
jgi:hypothetical protein